MYNCSRRPFTYQYVTQSNCVLANTPLVVDPLPVCTYTLRQPLLILCREREDPSVYQDRLVTVVILAFKELQEPADQTVPLVHVANKDSRAQMEDLVPTEMPVQGGPQDLQEIKDH